MKDNLMPLKVKRGLVALQSTSQIPSAAPPGCMPAPTDALTDSAPAPLLPQGSPQAHQPMPGAPGSAGVTSPGQRALVDVFPAARSNIACFRPLIREWTLPSGKIIYVSSEPIGLGSYGEVFPGLDATGTGYAIKSSRRLGYPSPSGRRVTRHIEDIKREFAVAKRIEAAADMEAFCIGNDICWTMPLRVGSVDQVRNALGLDPARELAPYLLIALLQKLEPLHASGFAHGDLKLDNILVGFDGAFHLGDPGQAHPFAAQGIWEAGDYNRTAPEQQARGALIDKSDMWALGILIWEVAGACANPLCGKQAQWLNWHTRQPRDAAGRIDAARLTHDGADGWAAKLQALPPAIADILLNDLNHPDAAQRSFAAALRTRVQTVWPQGSTDEARLTDLCVSAARDLPAARRRAALLTWLEDSDQPSTPRGQMGPRQLSASDFVTP